MQIWMVTRLLYFCFWECLVWGYSSDTFSFPREVSSVIIVLKLGQVPYKVPCVPFLTTQTLCTTFRSWPWERKSPSYCPREGREQAVSAAWQSLLLPQPPIQKIPCSRYTARLENSLNWAQGEEPHPDLQGQPALWWGHSSRPCTITVAHTNCDEAFRWQMLGGHSSHIFEKYFYYRKTLLL